MDVLMLISSEAEEVQMLSEARVGERQAALEAREAREAREREDALGFFANIFPHKPTPAERNISGASSVSAISSTSTYRGKERHHSWYNNPHSPRSEDLDEEEEFGRISEVSLEETLSVCYALANLCEASERYARRMFQSGLFSITLKLVRSRHMEISRQ
ncbi:hypothetical protein B484DRAFT_411770, partial [Ochromonadaceae sp. CCMP2298]